MPATSIGFWRVLLGTVCLGLWALGFRRELFRVDARGWLLVGLGGGILVALFELAYQFAIAGAGVAGAAALLYTAPVIVAVLARVILKEGLTTVRLLLAVVVMVGVALTVTGGSNAGARSEEHTSELQSPCNLVCRLLLEKKKKRTTLKNAIQSVI